jgi:hypothetical protein
MRSCAKSIVVGAFAQTLRGKIHEIEDAEFETIAPKAITPNDVTNKNAA